MKNRQPMGPTGNCVCAACGASMPHAPGLPCRELRCPGCGKAMVREGSAHHAAAVEGRAGRARRDP
jgi:predicted amidophosphoribosyltransferase